MFSKLIRPLGESRLSSPTTGKLNAQHSPCHPPCVYAPAASGHAVVGRIRRNWGWAAPVALMAPKPAPNSTSLKCMTFSTGYISSWRKNRELLSLSTENLHRLIFPHRCSAIKPSSRSLDQERGGSCPSLPLCTAPCSLLPEKGLLGAGNHGLKLGICPRKRKTLAQTSVFYFGEGMDL